MNSFRNPGSYEQQAQNAALGETVFLPVLVALEVRNQEGVREKKFSFCRDIKGPDSILACATSVSSFPLCFSTLKLPEIIRAGGRECLPKNALLPMLFAQNLVDAENTALRFVDPRYY